LEKKNIVIFTNTLLSGGAEKQALLLAVKLNPDHHVLLVVYFGEQVEEKHQKVIAANGIRTVYLNGILPVKIWRFYRLLRLNQVSVIFSYLLTTNLIGALTGKLAGVKVRAGGIRNALIDPKKLPLQRLINNHLNTHTIYNNYQGAELLAKQGLKMDHAVVIPNCFELNTTETIREAAGVIKLITVGRFVPQKGYFEALKIMQALKNDGLEFKYFLIGFGEQEAELRAEISRLSLEDAVTLLVNPPDIMSYYQRADIYLCTSYFEGLSNTVMEALSCSLPVVASDAGDNRRLVRDGVNGYVVPEVRSELFIAPLKKLMASAELRNQFGLESYKLIRDHYSGAAFKENYENFIISSDA
jgi:glycosyltransferase involved in cell wall biosynthesis